MKRLLWIACQIVLALGASAASSDDLAGRGAAGGENMIAAPLGNAITYQGRLEKNNVPVSGNCNLIFKLYDALTAGTQFGSTVTLSNQLLTEGLFVGALDFGAGVFNGQARWLEIQVQGPGDPGFTLLSPRQAISPAPYSLFSLNSTGSQWVNDANGIEYAGNTGIGTASRSDVKLWVNAAPGNHSLYLTNNDDARATLFVRNFAPGGYGFFDDTSIRHYIGGKLGVGTTNPFGKVHVTSSNETAVIGQHTGNWVGVYGESQSGTGVWGNALSTGTGVQGANSTVGAFGYLGHGNGWAVLGDNTLANTRGIMGTPTDGVVGIVHSAAHIAGRFENDAVGGTALYANGVAKVKTLQILGGADLAERFEATEKAAPGTVMAIDPRSPGSMRISDEPYCRRVAGVVSGAQSLAAGVILGDGEATEAHLPIALTGRVWVKCDATQAPIRPGDLLTTAATPGHAMAAVDPVRAAGAVLGKAMTSLEAGTGMVLVLVSLQ